MNQNQPDSGIPYDSIRPEKALVISGGASGGHVTAADGAAREMQPGDPPAWFPTRLRSREIPARRHRPPRRDDVAARIVAVLELGALIAAKAAHGVAVNNDVAEVDVMILVGPLEDHDTARFQCARVLIVSVRHGRGVVRRLVSRQLKRRADRRSARWRRVSLK